MNQVSSAYKNCLVLSILLVLFLPMLQNKFQMIAVGPLKGVIDHPKQDSLKMENWMSGDYQQQQANFLN
ncbi:MAG TPA: hypothetical protein PL029_11880, partial [Bacteroidia bacterium]|nr:hypothetical protein [Bacteroidia bacterium]